MSERCDIGVCGGGNLAHAIAAALACKGHRVHVLTRSPDKWGQDLWVSFCGAEYRRAPLAEVSRDAESLRACQYIFAALPRFAVPQVCCSIKSILSQDKTLLFAPGSPHLLRMQRDMTWQGIRFGAFHKVPYICRTDDYGHRVSILGGRPLNRIWFSDPSSATDLKELETFFDTPLELLSSAWPFLLTNSNPLLHPSRMRVLFSDYQKGRIYDSIPMFYEEWTKESSELYLRADDELMRLCELCPEMSVGRDIIPVREYYESPDAEALTRKIRSIPAFRGIAAPMVRCGDGWLPDFHSRYFQEDIRWGTMPICAYARQLGVDTPVLDEFVQWTLQQLRLHAPETL